MQTKNLSMDKKYIDQFLKEKNKQREKIYNSI